MSKKTTVRRGRKAASGDASNRIASRKCVALSMCALFLGALGGPVAQTVRSSIVDNRHSDILELEFPHGQFADPLEFRDQYAAYHLLRKFPFLNVQVDRQAAALASFKEAEVACELANRRFIDLTKSFCINDWRKSVLLQARENIRSLLGAFSWNHAEEHFAFSSGASTRLPRRKGDAFFKYQGKPEATPLCRELAIAVIRSRPLWAAMMVEQYGYDTNNWVKLVIGNRVITVPKSAKTDRTIAIEPCMNMYVQKGIGGMLRQRLKRVGIDLDNQSRNQRLALEGSIGNLLATIDLSSASDSISLELVRFLMPHDWFDAIELTRSHYGTMPDGTVAKYHKVSSMGNGFTFELESLIFWAITRALVSHRAASERRVAVYGDDIICSREVVPELLDVFSFCGFTVNKEKSFWDGPFRESCGKHYFAGLDVTPIYVKDRLDSDLRLIWFANSIRRFSSRFYSDGAVADARFKPVWEEVRKLISFNSSRVSIPDGLGDGGLVGTFDEACPTFSRRRQRFIADVLQEASETFRPNGPAAVLRYFQASEEGPLDTIQLVSRGTKVRVSTVSFEQWTSGLPWLEFGATA